MATMIEPVLSEYTALNVNDMVLGVDMAELKSEEFRALRAQIRKCQENRFLIFKYSQQ